MSAKDFLKGRKEAKERISAYKKPIPGFEEYHKRRSVKKIKSMMLKDIHKAEKNLKNEGFTKKQADFLRGLKSGLRKK